MIGAIFSPLGRWMLGLGLLAALVLWSYTAGRNDGRAACNTAVLEAHVKALTQRAEAAEKAADEYAERLRIDNELDRLNEDRANATPPNPDACLPADSARRLRIVR